MGPKYEKGSIMHHTDLTTEMQSLERELKKYVHIADREIVRSNLKRNPHQLVQLGCSV